MRHSDTRPTAVPGVVDGSLTISMGADREVSLHVELGSDGGLSGRAAQFEIILGPQDAEIVRAALAADSGGAAPFGMWPSSVPCQIGIHVGL
ncbi:hypothetical protein M2158_007798 [Streptomyces sp. SAI-144]|jgi:hypothetical protein|uniref:hypothetical protein n=1 Tax=unclassified Streptomyces TaxID=2593676 RepID=UPI0024770DE9|nr:MULTISPECIES: hypothetical protein [unclassified Streptomyces]MDH6439257.1 hypothetical protein [Streptomyces sp. SAI-144]MDH6486639.1 hypothetical protein [Streptomyces sp. SAI-127]